ncbi:hypothetical protein [Nonomuraea sp. NPDC005650]|uniref:hypothetical protein n=1 Tax=Nonomuraea sp. NPDC005650 TaxID=3157045 RepID=UPI0033A0BC53
MFSRSKRIFGIAILSLAAATAVAVPAQANTPHTNAIAGELPVQLLSKMRAPLCLPTGALAGETKLNLPLVESLLPQLSNSCG